MKFKKIIVTLLFAMLLISAISVMTACKDEGDGTCTKHTDADGDDLCDTCSQQMGSEPEECSHTDSNGDDVCDDCDEYLGITVEDVDLSITVKDPDGAPYSGISVNITDSTGKIIASGLTDKSGKFQKTLPEGEYSIFFDIDSDGYIYVPAGQVNVTKDNCTFEYSAVDNTPDGTAEKPFFLSLDEQEYTIPGGTAYTFTIKGEARLLVIESESIKVLYGGNEYLPTEGKVEIMLSGTENPNDPPVPFTVTNTTDTDAKINITFTSAPGSRSNPYEASLGVQSTPSAVSRDNALYYVWTAKASGTISLSSSTAGNDIVLSNPTTSQVSDRTDGETDTPITLDVKAGDKIRIEISATDDPTEVEFELSFTAYEK